MAETIIYEGPTKPKEDSSTVFYVDNHRFDKGVPVSVEDAALAKELKEGSDRLKGHKFSGSKKKALRESTEQPTVAPTADAPAPAAESTPAEGR